MNNIAYLHHPHLAQHRVYTNGGHSVPYNSAHHHRRSIRLKGFDYAQTGMYFVTICTHRCACILGHITDDRIHLSAAGDIVAATWQSLALRYSYVELDAWVVMPNHFHGILAMTPDDPRDGIPIKPKPLGQLIGQFKMVSAKEINLQQETRGTPVWQRDFYDHIIRDDGDLHRIRDYIQNNPLRWAQDSLYPET